jgi:hypothetical protein
LVAILIKWAIAAIPAAIVVTVIMMIISGLFMLLGAGWMMRGM